MLRRRSRTIPDDDPQLDDPSPPLDLAEPGAGSGALDVDALDLGLDLSGLRGPTGAEPDEDDGLPRHMTAARRAAPLRAAVAAAPADGLSTEIQTVVSETVSRVLANAFVELELDPDTMQDLREQSALAKLLEAVHRIDQQTAQIDGMARQLQALTTAVDELTESTRALLRHQWDNMPPQNFWVRVQRADDEVRRAVDELAAEVRGRNPRPGRA
jgi:hypothetical protein